MRNIYGSVNGAREGVEHIYGPVNNARKKVVKVYGSVNGARKLMWQEIPRIENVSGGTVTPVDVEGFITFLEGFVSVYPDLTGHVVHVGWVESGLPVPGKVMRIDDDPQRYYFPAGFQLSTYFNYTITTPPLTFDVTLVR